jgi:hypothetical protein
MYTYRKKNRLPIDKLWFKVGLIIAFVLISCLFLYLFLNTFSAPSP